MQDPKVRSALKLTSTMLFTRPTNNTVAEKPDFYIASYLPAAIRCSESEAISDATYDNNSVFF